MLDEKTLNALREKYGEIRAVRYNGRDIVFRKPTRVQVTAHAMAVENPSEKPFADEQLARQIVVYPSREEFAALVDRFPYMTRNEKIGTALGKLTGILEDEEEKNFGEVSSGSGSPREITPTA